MNRIHWAGRAKRAAVTLTTTALLLATLLASTGAGPDEPKASSIDDNWQMFEGHAFVDSRAAPEGIALVACLGGCADGYVSPPVLVGEDGLYSGLKVAGPEGQSALPEGRLITFWLVENDARVPAVQEWLFTGDGKTRMLDLSFRNVPRASGGTAAGEPSGVTTDLTIPSPAALGLVPADSARAYANGFRYGGWPLLPGFAVVAGIMVGAIGSCLLIYRRRLSW